MSVPRLKANTDGLQSSKIAFSGGSCAARFHPESVTEILACVAHVQGLGATISQRQATGVIQDQHPSFTKLAS